MFKKERTTSNPISNLVDPAKLSVVLCSYNGERHLAAQLDSISTQSMRPDHLIISDDKSRDRTPAIIDNYCSVENRFFIQHLNGPQKGYAANFLSSLRAVDPRSRFTALSDQDDVWFAEKLERATTALAAVGSAPALYGAATLQCDALLNPLNVSRIATVRLGFPHALTQNFAGGNTMVFNNSALRIIQKALEQNVLVQAHDWWLYQLISGAGGQIIFDRKPTLRYRLHGGNQVGKANRIEAALERSKRMLRGEYKQWNTANFRSLIKVRHLLTTKNQAILNDVIRGRGSHLINRISLMQNPRIRRQGTLGQIGLLAALTLNSF